ncbi:MAG: OmpA family protein [Neisseriaceae bacterium]|nr:OmpA family protein [Neisseriaceae bacterium]
MNKLLTLPMMAILTACVSQPVEYTVYEPLHLDGLDLMQVSDVVHYAESEIPVLSTGEYRPLMRRFVWQNNGSGSLNDGNAKMVHVYFDTNKSNITKRGVAELSGSLNDPDFQTVHLKGYADPRGSNLYNQKLSERRTNAVAKYLKGKGVTVLSTDSFGEDDLPEYEY